MGFGSVAAVCRNGVGLYLGAPTIVFKGISDPATLEVLAVWEPMALAEDLHLEAIHVAMNCKGIVDDIKQKNSSCYEAIIHEIIEYSHIFQLCNFVHEFRILNFEAHNLAKHVLKLGVGHQVWVGHPGELSLSL